MWTATVFWLMNSRSPISRFEHLQLTARQPERLLGLAAGGIGRERSGDARLIGLLRGWLAGRFTRDTRCCTRGDGLATVAARRAHGRCRADSGG